MLSIAGAKSIRGWGSRMLRKITRPAAANTNVKATSYNSFECPISHEQFEQYSVHELCEALNISHGTFYNHIFRRADRTEYLQRQQELMLQVQRIFDDSQQRFRAEKIRIILAENEICVGKSALGRSCKSLT